jgi:hypothetical protein
MRAFVAGEKPYQSNLDAVLGTFALKTPARLAVIPSWALIIAFGVDMGKPSPLVTERVSFHPKEKQGVTGLF